MEDRLSLALADDERVAAARAAMATVYQPAASAMPTNGMPAAATYVERPSDFEPVPESAAGLPPSESTNVWPDEAAEAAFISEARGRGESVALAPATPKSEPGDDKPLPKLDELVKRIPEDTRELLDELFRAKFVAVRRVPKDLLKP